MKTKIHRNPDAMTKSSPDLRVHEQIALRAYEIWLDGGRPQGEELAHWLQAENEVLLRLGQSRTQRAPAGF
jgi:hypothetical protein